MDQQLVGTNGTKPEIVEPEMTQTETPAAETKTRKPRRVPTEADIAEMKRLRAADVTFVEVARQTGFSVGSVQKYCGEPKPKTEGKKRGPKPKAERAPAAKAGPLDTAMAVRAAMGDLLLAGHPLADIRGALASLNLGGH